MALCFGINNMLETLDFFIKKLINQQYDYDLDDIVWAPESFALRARSEKLKKDKKQDENKFFPFVSYFRTNAVPDFTRYRKSKVSGAGVPAGTDAASGKTAFLRIMPVTVTYEVLFWEKDYRNINNILRVHSFKTGRITALKFTYQDRPVTMGCDISGLDYAVRIPKFEENLSKGQIFNTSFSMTVKSYMTPGSVPGEEIIEEVLDSGNGTKTVFSGITSKSPLKTGTVTINYTIGGTPYSITDDGDGNFTDPTIASGTVDYVSGQYNIEFANPLDSGTDLTVDYTVGGLFGTIKSIIVNFGDIGTELIYRTESIDKT